MKAESGSRYLFGLHSTGGDHQYGGRGDHDHRADAGGGATLNIPVDLPTALLLSVVASLCACGASGVAGGSLLLIPLACNMFGIPNDVAMQVVAVGFIIGVLQDSCETALNSSTDALFTAAACIAEDDQLAKNALRS